MSVNLDWCSGCDVPLNKRVNLPDGWVEGDLILEGVTIHTERVRDDTGFELRRRFAFVGDPLKGVHATLDRNT
jgi:hypothetical protein